MRIPAPPERRRSIICTGIPAPGFVREKERIGRTIVESRTPLAREKPRPRCARRRCARGGSRPRRDLHRRRHRTMRVTQTQGPEAAGRGAGTGAPSARPSRKRTSPPVSTRSTSTSTRPEPRPSYSPEVCRSLRPPSSSMARPSRAGWRRPSARDRGERCGSPNDALELASGASGSTIRGLCINRSPEAAIHVVDSANNVIAGNFLGTDLAGTTTAGFGNIAGVNIHGGASTSNRVGGTAAADRNIISGNTVDGVQIISGSNNLVQGNYIGTDMTGTLNRGNTNQGVAVFAGASSNTIGGTGGRRQRDLRQRAAEASRSASSCPTATWCRGTASGRTPRVRPASPTSSPESA